MDNQYPLSGGIRPENPNFPAEKNPKVQELEISVMNQANEIKLLNTIITYLQNTVQKQEEIIFALIGKKAQ